jgi:dUTP pyrophosphatase
VADHVSPVDDHQVQPNGVDLTLDAVFEQTNSGWVGREGKSVGDRQELDTRPAGTVRPDGEDGDDDTPSYVLSPGGYVLRYTERVEVPEGHVGFLYPRSTLLRNSCMLHTAVWDTGYRGVGEGLLEVHHEVVVEAGARVGQFVLAAADSTGSYTGTYHRENL